MAGNTKDDYDSLYSIRVLVPVPGKPNNFKRSPIRLHYHRHVIKPMLDSAWAHVIPLLSLTSADRVVIVGSGFGWGVEALIEQTGCDAVGIDISDYVDTTKADTEESEIDAAIIAAGYDPLTGHGLEVKNLVYDGGAKVRGKFLKNDLSTNKLRNDVKKELGNQWPTWIITEDMLSDFTDQEVTAWKTEAEKLDPTVQICHILRANYPPNSRTGQQWADFTGHTVITIGDWVRHDPV